MLRRMSRPDYLFLVCPDAALARREAERVAASSGAGFDWTVHHGDEPLSPDLWRDLQSVSLLGGAKALFIRKADKLPAAVWKELSPILASGPSGWVLLCVEAEWKRDTPSIPKIVSSTRAWKHAQERGWVWQSPGLAGQGLSAYVRQGLAERNLPAPGPLMQALVKQLPADAALVDNELDKLALAAGKGNELAPEHLQVLSEPPGLGFWEMFTVLTEGGDIRALWREVANADSGLLFQLLRTMERELPTLWLLAEGRSDAVKLPGWLKNKKARLARNLTPADIAGVYDLLLAAEHGVKSGSVNERQALERLVAGLSAAFAPKASARGGRW